VKIAGNTFLVTGGASGLGAGTVRHLVAAGGRVAIVDVERKRGETLAAELGALFFPADVTDESQVSAAIRDTCARFDSLHGVVNCAGIASAERLLSRDGPHKLDAFARVVNTNLVGTFNVVRLAAQAMATNAPEADGERGIVINTASIAAFEGQIGQAAYSASKAGIVGMTLPIARELARFGIRVMTIAPGVFETPMMDGMSETVRASLRAQVPFPARLGKAAEYAALAAHIIENPMLNGAVIRLDGAMRLASK
jgi:NAD(P)-dependent dehydrogenase (short-subunit alcohol dehydrogenase family)